MSTRAGAPGTGVARRPEPPPVRAARLEDLLGDPAAHRPAGHRALLAADRRGRPPAEAEALLDDFGMGAELVPRALGGHFDSAEGLLRILRPAARRDLALGAGALDSFAAASPVWAAGRPDQRAALAALLRSGERAALAAPAGLADHTLQVRGPGLHGAASGIAQLPRARALVVFPRREPERTGHTALLLDPAALPPDRARLRPRPPGPGLRHIPYGDLEFTDCPVPGGSLLGDPGDGMPLALRSLRTARTLTAALCVGAADTALRTAALTGRPDHDSRGPQAGSERRDPRRTAAVLSAAFADLLLCDSLALAATRALHLRPAESALCSTAAASLLPRLLRGTLQDLSTLLGARILGEEGGAGILAKHLRDLPALGAAARCRAALIPQLPLLARESWSREPEPSGELFHPGGPLPPFAHAPLTTAARRDVLGAALLATAEQPFPDDPAGRALATLTRQLRADLLDLRDTARALPAPRPGHAAAPAWFSLADRCVLLLAAGAVLGVWRHRRAAGDPFLADPAWAATALHRLAVRLGAPAVDLPASCTARLHAEVLARCARRESLDLYRTALAG
ncbi:hypothetical protein SLNWT_0254 [Streptomyces albus]|uniref:Acyl-CoA dehydrogenase n=1 Tax=Streptomyces albus (strain ATCC 21838 / DSM 41398 / FERM P-419 / JCM 4703 / NBRC 107858) TaxID=1081613 RepID=A0A0B5EMN4_STRA4|nr:hypothetical protein SLNWT_0254 [Streptomyces albus]AOU74943.1 hypothetical protein SLNHY_0252 [Streptomyces albus]AYN30751.1 hypothetical protein DUI70_0249 [Streptomyces albus]